MAKSQMEVQPPQNTDLLFIDGDMLVHDENDANSDEDENVQESGSALKQLKHGEWLMREGEQLCWFGRRLLQGSVDYPFYKRFLQEDGRHTLSTGKRLIQKGKNLILIGQKKLLQKEFLETNSEEIENNELYTEIKLGGKDSAIRPSTIPEEVLNKIRTKLLPFSCMESPNNECSICMDEFRPNDIVKRIGCLHHFHHTCINKWLKIHKTCPVCRTPISTISPSLMMLYSLCPLIKGQVSQPGRFLPVIHRSYTITRQINTRRITFINYLPSLLLVNDEYLGEIDNGEINAFDVTVEFNPPSVPDQCSESDISDGLEASPGTGSNNPKNIYRKIITTTFDVVIAVFILFKITTFWC